MALRLITAPTTEPVTLTEAKLYARLPADTTDDAVVTALIVAARQACEQELQRALITQTWERTLDTWPEAVRLDYPPIASVTYIKYLEAEAGVLTVLSAASYIVDSTSEPGYVQPAYGYDWPSLYPEINAVIVRYVAGYGAASAVPEAIKTWIKAMVAHYYEHREAVLELGSMAVLPFLDRLLDPYRIY